MRLWMILGGLLGFVIGISFGIAQGSAWPSVIWRASVATFLAGVLLRWWGGIWIKGLRQAQQARLESNDRDEGGTVEARKRI